MTTDQRGFARSTPPSADIGAFQTQRSRLVVNTTIDGAASPSGELDLRQAVNLANVLAGPRRSPSTRPSSPPPQTITLTGQLELSNTSGTRRSRARRRA